MNRVPLVDNQTFVLATRETGYRNIASAVSELVDNSIQAGARTIDIILRRNADGNRPAAVAVLDDGSGMTARTLTRALQFGGTDRFNDRQGTGRFGMGLPNASVS